MITPLLNETKRVTDVFFEVMRGKEEGVGEKGEIRLLSVERISFGSQCSRCKGNLQVKERLSLRCAKVRFSPTNRG